jgi:hypothetical protein
LSKELSHDEALEKTVCVLLVRGENPDGGGIFAYVAVRADRLEEFMEAQQDDLFYPEDYGVIIESGEGEPSEEIRQKMEEEYGFNHEAMMDIPDAGAARAVTENLESEEDDEGDEGATPSH